MITSSVSSVALCPSQASFPKETHSQDSCGFMINKDIATVALTVLSAACLGALVNAYLYGVRVSPIVHGALIGSSAVAIPGALVVALIAGVFFWAMLPAITDAIRESTI